MGKTGGSHPGQRPVFRTAGGSSGADPDVRVSEALVPARIEYADGSSELVVSDENWKITHQGPIRANSEFDGEEYDARREQSGWDRRGSTIPSGSRRSSLLSRVENSSPKCWNRCVLWRHSSRWRLPIPSRASMWPTSGRTCTAWCGSRCKDLGIHGSWSAQPLTATRTGWWTWGRTAAHVHGHLHPQRRGLGILVPRFAGRGCVLRKSPGGLACRRPTIWKCWSFIATWRRSVISPARTSWLTRSTPTCYAPFGCRNGVSRWIRTAMNAKPG